MALEAARRGAAREITPIYAPVQRLEGKLSGIREERRSGFSSTRPPAITSFGNLPKASFIRFESTILAFVSLRVPTPLSNLVATSLGIAGSRSLPRCTMHDVRDGDSTQGKTRRYFRVTIGTIRKEREREPDRTPKWISCCAEKLKRSPGDFLLRLRSLKVFGHEAEG